MKQSAFLFGSSSKGLSAFESDATKEFDSENGNEYDRVTGNKNGLTLAPKIHEEPPVIISDPVGSGGDHEFTDTGTGSENSNGNGSNSENGEQNFEITNFDYSLLNPVVLYDKYPTATLIGGGVLTLLILRKLFR